MSIKGTDKVKAFQCMILVQPTEDTKDTHPETIVIGDVGGPKKGIVIDCGSEVPELQEGDLVYYLDEIPLEDGLVAVHFQEVVSFRRYE